MSIGGLASALLMAMGAMSAGAAAPPREVAVADGAVRLGDVFDISDLPASLRKPAQSLVVIQLAPGQDQLQIHGAALWDRAGVLMPALSALPAPDGAGAVLILRTRSIAPPNSSCLRVILPAARGSYPTTEAFAPAPCEIQRPAPAFQYDADLGVVRAARDLTPGELIIAPPEGAIAVVAADQPMYLQTTVGAVTLQRAVTTVRAVREGAAAVVKTSDGSVFSAPAAEGH